MESTRTILIAEEDPATRAFLTDNLAADGYRDPRGRRPRERARQALRAPARPRRLRRQRRHARPHRRRPPTRTASPRDPRRHAADRAHSRSDELTRVRYLDRGETTS